MQEPTGEPTRDQLRSRSPETASNWTREDRATVTRSRRLRVVPDGRPKARGDCVDGPRPCPWYGCRHHLGLDVRKGGAIRYVHDLETMASTCALDVAEAGGVTLVEIGELYGYTRERARQVFEVALRSLNAAIPPELRDELRSWLLEALARPGDPEPDTIDGDAVSGDFAQQVRRAYARLHGRYGWRRAGRGRTVEKQE